MRPVPFPPVQLITGAWRDTADLRARVEAALRGGIRWVQLRDKQRSARELHAAACLLAPMVRDAGGLFVVNDRVDVAMAAGAGGVHLPERGMTVRDARRLLGSAAWIARSVHAGDAIVALAEEGADAVQFGPVFATPSKRDFGDPQGLDRLSRAGRSAREAGTALVAVGGIVAGLAPGCLEAGANAVAVIGAVWEAGDVETAARELVAAVS